MVIILIGDGVIRLPWHYYIEYSASYITVGLLSRLFASWLTRRADERSEAHAVYARELYYFCAALPGAFVHQ